MKIFKPKSISIISPIVVLKSSIPSKLKYIIGKYRFAVSLIKRISKDCEERTKLVSNEG